MEYKNGYLIIKKKSNIYLITSYVSIVLFIDHIYFEQLRSHDQFKKLINGSCWYYKSDLEIVYTYLLLLDFLFISWYFIAQLMLSMLIF